MDDEGFRKLQDQIFDLGKQYVSLAGAVTKLQAAVSVLKILAASSANPTDPEAALKVLRDAEGLALKHDPNEQARQYAAEIIDSLELLRKHGPPGSS